MNGRGLNEAVVIRGLGLHTGQPSKVTLYPTDTCGWFVNGERVDLTTSSAVPGGTDWWISGHRIRTVEHLCAALLGLGVTHVSIGVDGPEVPVLDGSALSWVERLVPVLTELDEVPIMSVKHPFSYSGFGGSVHIAPCSGREVAVDVEFGQILCGAVEVDLCDLAELNEIFGARTFVFSGDLAQLKREGRGLGATTSNTVVWPAPPEALRFPDEPVRHKLLDAIGDLAQLGQPLRGRVVVEKGSHRLHLAALQAAVTADAIQ